MIAIVLICLIGSPVVIVYLANSSAGLPSVTIMLMIAATMLILASPWILASFGGSMVSAKRRC